MLRTLLLAAVLAAASLRAEIDRSKKPEPGPAPEAAFPDAVIATLPNGLRIYVIEDDRKPTLSMRLAIKAGSALDAKPGTADFVAALLNRGTKTMDALAIAKAVDSLGAKLEAGAGADSTSVSISGLTKSTDKLLALFADAVLNPVFPAEEFAKEQKRTISGLVAAKKDPGSLAGKLMNKVLYGDHPYGAITTPETVSAINRDDLVKFHQQWFAPNIASIAVVGDVKAADIIAKLTAVFGGWEKKEIPAVKKAAIRPIEGFHIHLLDLSPSVQSNIIVTHLAPPRNFPDLPELNVVNSTLGGGFSGRLFQNLRETHGYTYGSSCAFGYNAEAGFFQATAQTRNEVTAPAIKEILNEMNRIRDEVIPEDELALQRDYNVGNYLLSLENAGRVASRIQDIWLYDLAPDFYKTYAKRMAAVTPASAQSLAKKYLSTQNAAVVVVGEANQIRAELEKLSKVTLYDTDLKIVQ